MRMAKKHWEEYLRVEPEGYYSRKAREEIEAIMKIFLPVATRQKEGLP
jgi:hypothetical protein